MRVPKRYIFLILVGMCCYGFFQRNNFRTVSEVKPQLLNDPVQKETHRPEIVFSKDGFEFHITPVYTYQIHALVVGKMDYHLFNINKYESIFPIDLCLIWGDNVKNKVYQNRSVRFSQDCRWCWVNWGSGVSFNLNQFSNNHLLINNKQVMHKAKSVVRGDQIALEGLLVNVKALPLKRSQEAREVTWNSSVSRVDSGAGSCEVMYVEDFTILKKANVVSSLIFTLSFYSLLIWGAWNTVRFFLSSSV